MMFHGGLKGLCTFWCQLFTIQVDAEVPFIVMLDQLNKYFSLRSKLDSEPCWLEFGIIFLSQNFILLYSQLYLVGIIFAASRKEGRMMREESRGVSCVFCSTPQEISLYHTTVERPYTTYMSLFSKAIWTNLCTSHTHHNYVDEHLPFEVDVVQVLGWVSGLGGNSGFCECKENSKCNEAWKRNHFLAFASHQSSSPDGLLFHCLADWIQLEIVPRK